MEENFNVDNDRSRRMHEISEYLSKADRGELDLSNELRTALIEEYKILSDADTKRYVSDNERDSKNEVAETDAKSRKEPWWRWLGTIVLGALLTEGIRGGFKMWSEKVRMDRYEAQHEKDLNWELHGTQTPATKSTEKKYNPYDVK